MLSRADRQARACRPALVGEGRPSSFGSIVLTSNRGFGDWGAVVAGGVVATFASEMSGSDMIWTVTLQSE